MLDIGAKISMVEGSYPAYFLRMENREIPLRTQDGGPLPLLPGWRPDRVLLGGDVSVMRLYHEDGHSALWFLDDQLRFETNMFDSLDDVRRQALLAKVPDFPLVPWEQTVSSPLTMAPDDASTISFEGVQLFRHWSPGELTALTQHWKDNDYVVVRSALTADAIEMLQERISFDQRHALDDPRQFYRIHNDPAGGEFILRCLDAAVPFYEAVLGINLLPSHGFAMNYIRNSDMDPHYDNIATPISSTVCYHFETNGPLNPLFLDKAKFLNPYPHRFTVKDRASIPSENIVRIDLRPGDLAIFHGRTHLHWRQAIAEEIDYRALLLHFLNYSYKGTLLTAKPVPHVDYTLIDVLDYEEFRKDYAMYFEKAGIDWT